MDAQVSLELQDRKDLQDNPVTVGPVLTVVPERLAPLAHLAIQPVLVYLLLRGLARLPLFYPPSNFLVPLNSLAL